MSALDVIGHALRVYYTDSRDPGGVVAHLLDAYRAEVLAEGAALVEDAACDADFTEDPRFIAGLRAAVALLTRATEPTTTTGKDSA